jgi:hypothetical protein
MTRISHVAGSAKRRLAALWDGPGFNVAALAGTAVGVWLLASGLDRMQEPVQRIVSNRTVAAAGSPLDYHQPMPGHGALATAGGWRFLVRLDSVPRQEEARLCATLRATHTSGTVVWLDLSGDLPSCAAGSNGARLHSSGDPSLLREELRGTRWVLMDERDRAVYSGRAVPSAAELAAFGELFRVVPESVR